MLELTLITQDPDLARRADALAGLRLMVDLERHGKAERQAGRNSFISTHVLADIGRVKAVLQRSPLLVRLNPLFAGSGDEINQALALGADLLMLPMFRTAPQLRAFCALVAGRVPVVALLETREALACLPEWVGTPGLQEVFVGLNDLHLSLGHQFMFQPLAEGLLDSVAQQVHAQGLRLGFGGIARMDEGLLPGRAVLAEHLRLGSGGVILSRTFQRSEQAQSFEDAVRHLRACEAALAGRNAAQIEADRLHTVAAIHSLVPTWAPAALA